MEEIKKQLFDKLMMNRFGWELNIGGEKFIIDAVPFSKEEQEEKIKQVNHVIDKLIEEKERHDKQIEEFKASDDEDAYYPLWHPTIDSMVLMSVDFDDTPIKEEDIYEIDESKVKRTIDKESNGYLLDRHEDHKKVLELIKLGEIQEIGEGEGWAIIYNEEHEELVMRYINFRKETWTELDSAPFGRSLPTRSYKD
jgi:hypothetical protein